jgi:hypothetical protein
VDRRREVEITKNERIKLMKAKVLIAFVALLAVLAAGCAIDYGYPAHEIELDEWLCGDRYPGHWSRAYSRLEHWDHGHRWHRGCGYDRGAGYCFSTRRH